MNEHKETWGGEWLKPFADALGIPLLQMNGIQLHWSAEFRIAAITSTEGTNLVAYDDLDVNALAAALGLPPLLQEITIEVDRRYFVTIEYRCTPDADRFRAACDVLKREVSHLQLQD